MKVKAASAPKGKAKASRNLSTSDLIDAKLKTSGLTHEDRKILRLEEADPDELRSLKLPATVPAMEIPYFETNGTVMKWKRWRYLADSRSPFEKLANKKERRYVQEPNTLCRFYFPPLKNWKRIGEDTRIDIAITEGEFKAACCTKFVMPCIGLGGVYSFKSKKNGVPLVRDFESIEWQDRKVVVVFDSDAESNPMVVGGRNALCAELFKLGAKVYVASLHPDEEGHKQGIDDLLVHEGIDALKQTLADAEPWGYSEALHQLNEEVCYIREPGLMVVLKTGQRLSPRDFTSHAYSNRLYKARVVLASGDTKEVERSAAEDWLKWPKRMELQKIVYTPGAEQITDDRCFNIWQGWGCEPREGDFSPWTKLLDHLFQGFPEERSWFERWCAYPLQNPGAKMFTASVIWGSQTGTGKSMTGYSLKRIYGPNFIEIGDKELQNTRYAWAENRQFVLGDDVTGQEQRKHADRLKAMITQQEMLIDKKYVPEFTVVDRINYLFTSNHSDAFFLEDDDRRFFVHEACVSPLPFEFYQNYVKWLDSPDGPSALFYHLLNLDLKGMDRADRAPNTQARKSMVLDGLSDVGAWVRALKEAPDVALALNHKKLAGDLWTSQDLLALYDPEEKKRVTANGLSRELKRAGFLQAYRGMPVKMVNGAQARLFIIRNHAAWAPTGKRTMKDAAAHYETTRLGIKPEDAGAKPKKSKF